MGSLHNVLHIGTLALAIGSFLDPTIAVAADVKAASKPWKVGDERELDAGLYVTLFTESDGWRVWREEGKSGINCAAVKPAKSIGHPTPMSSYFFFGGYPAIAVWETKVMSVPRLDWSILGRDFQPTTQEYRLVGDRFFTGRPDLFASPSEWNKLFALDGRIIEAHVGSWKYPAISVDYAERSGFIDLTGMAKIVAQVKACNLTI